jgi:endonuclease/exonuclease/phosphatase family metal-dependent hydrolase
MMRPENSSGGDVHEDTGPPRCSAVASGGPSRATPRRHGRSPRPQAQRDHRRAQNQYFGADLSPLVAPPAGDPNAAFLGVLGNISLSDIPARAQRQAREIARLAPDLVGLQEVLALACVDPTPAQPPGQPSGCDDSRIAGAEVDFLELTLAALEGLGTPYRAVATVDNFDTRSVELQHSDGTVQPLPGLPLVVGDDLVFITALDRDVILASAEIAPRVRPVRFPRIGCRRSADGCNYAFVAPVSLVVPGGTIDLAFERGFVGVDLRFGGHPYRFVTTHLEIPEPAPGVPASAFFQAAQAAQLITVLKATTPARRRLILVGDTNSSPEDEPIPGPLPLRPPFDQGIVPPYQQFVAAGFTDAWALRARLDPGFTCCQAADLLNPVSSLDQRIDMVFTRDAPERAQMRVFGDRQIDRTRSGLWPSDHAGLAARLRFPSEAARVAAAR